MATPGPLEGLLRLWMALPVRRPSPLSVAALEGAWTAAEAPRAFGDEGAPSEYRPWT